jgi:cytochrome P450
LLDPELKSDGREMPTIEDMAEEAFSICVAASDTTGSAMTVAAHHVINNPDIHATLIRELREAFTDAGANLPYAALEKLPYLTGVIKEGQR